MQRRLATALWPRSWKEGQRSPSSGSGSSKEILVWEKKAYRHKAVSSLRALTLPNDPTRPQNWHMHVHGASLRPSAPSGQSSAFPAGAPTRAPSSGRRREAGARLCLAHPATRKASAHPLAEVLFRDHSSLPRLVPAPRGPPRATAQEPRRDNVAGLLGKGAI